MKWNALEQRAQFSAPFPHFIGRNAIDEDANATLAWLEADAPWRLKVADFYEQYEFSLLDTDLPPHVGHLIAPERMACLRTVFSAAFDCKLSNLIEVTAHKLIPGQRIRIHNDHIPGRESHRFLIQLNRGVPSMDGGELILFGSQQPPRIEKVLKPAHNSCVGFEISPHSNHAVAPIQTGERYTLVYSFFRAQ